MKFIENFLEKVAIIQKKYRKLLLIIFFLITIFMIFGIPKIRMESDMEKSMPQDLPIYKLNNKVRDTFGGQDIILVVLKISDEMNSKDLPKDIRDVQVVEYISSLENSLVKESSIESVTSLGNIFRSFSDINQNQIDTILNNNQELNQFFSKDYKSTFMLVKTDVGGSEEKVKSTMALIEDKIDSYPKPPGTNIMVTGTPPMRTTILRILGEDAIFTLVIAFIIIFFLLIILEKSLSDAILISLPLLIGLIWTIGTMGWLGIEISIATAGLGAMILGLGVEYGVFILKRYEEERDKNNNQLDSLKVAIPAVGSAILGSGLTTTIGFLALTLSILPMIQKLGLSLALGIFYCLFSAVFISPVIIITFEKLKYKFDDYIYSLAKKTEAKHHGLD